MNIDLTAYLYKQIIVATKVDSQASNTMTMFYAPNVKIYRGVDNEFRVSFKNKDQKKINLLDKTVTLTVINKDDGVSYLQRNVEVVDAQLGLGKIRITETDLLNLDAKYYTYALRVTDGEGNTDVAYVDDNWGANGTLELVEGVYPTFTASTEENFSSGNTGSTIYLPATGNRNDAVHTAQVYFSSAFTGTLKIEGSLSPATQGIGNNDFVTIKTLSYTAQEGTVSVTWKGIYSAVRFTRSTTTGTLSKVLYRP
jgi:hypothetical protein